MPRLLLIGLLPIKGDVVGGTKVSFKQLVDEFALSGRFHVEIINISRPVSGYGRLIRGLLHSLTFVKLMWRLLKSVATSDIVMFNVSARGVLYAGPIVWLAARCWQRPLVVRVFGGDFGVLYDHCRPLVRRIASKTFMRSELFLLQTQELCTRFSTSRWFPTTRDLKFQSQRKREGCRRFVFISQLRPEKGWREAVHASSELPDECSLNVYGPVMAGTDLDVFDNAPRASYCGPIQPKNVPQILAQHDALLFPTYYSGEGIPGIVIEALQSGLPVIATRWGTIPELIEDGTSGTLVEPQRIDELSIAMSRIVDNPELFRRMSKAAKRRGDDFRSSDWQRQLELWCSEVCGLIPKESSPMRRKAA